MMRDHDERDGARADRRDLDEASIHLDEVKQILGAVALRNGGDAHVSSLVDLAEERRVAFEGAIDQLRGAVRPREDRP